MSFHFYCTRYSITIILALGLAGTAAEAQTATRGFESSTADTWSYTPTPATIQRLRPHRPMGSAAQRGYGWGKLTLATLLAGANLWGERNLEGP